MYYYFLCQLELPWQRNCVIGRPPAVGMNGGRFWKVQRIVLFWGFSDSSFHLETLFSFQSVEKSVIRTRDGFTPLASKQTKVWEKTLMYLRGNLISSCLILPPGGALTPHWCSCCLHSWLELQQFDVWPEFLLKYLLYKQNKEVLSERFVDLNWKAAQISCFHRWIEKPFIVPQQGNSERFRAKHIQTHSVKLKFMEKFLYSTSETLCRLIGQRLMF